MASKRKPKAHPLKEAARQARDQSRFTMPPPFEPLDWWVYDSVRVRAGEPALIEHGNAIRVEVTKPHLTGGRDGGVLPGAVFEIELYRRPGHAIGLRIRGVDCMLDIEPEASNTILIKPRH